jgi:branched-chain amino acid transport system substrate-binding protein
MGDDGVGHNLHRALLVCLCVFWGAFVLNTLLACSKESPIQIGFIGGTTGRGADLGISGRDAAQFLIEARNAQGGIGGRRIELIIQDDKQDPAVARRAVEALIDAGVDAIIGPMTSGMGMVVAPLLDDASIVNVSPTVTTQKLSGRDDHFFRVTTTTLGYARKSAQFNAGPGGLKRMAATYDLGNLAYSENWLDNFTTAFTGHGGEILTAIGFSADKGAGFLALARELLKEGPDGVLIIANSMDSAMICQQIRKLDPHVRITLSDWGATERLLELGGRAVEGVTVIQPFDRDSTAPRYQAFRQAYLDRYGRDPGFPGVYAYDATQVVLTALSARKKGRSLKETLLEIRQFEGLQGPIRFDDFGEVEGSNVSISIVRNQKFIVLE